MKLSKEATEWAESECWAQILKIENENESSLQTIFKTWRVGNPIAPIVKNHLDKSKNKLLKIAEIYCLAYKREERKISDEDWDELMLLIKKKTDQCYQQDSALILQDISGQNEQYIKSCLDQMKRQYDSLTGIAALQFDVLRKDLVLELKNKPINKNTVKNILEDNLDYIKSNIFVLEGVSDANGEVEVSIGTCFYLEGHQLITCAHVIADDLQLFTVRDFNNKYPVKVLYKDDNKDVAIIEVPGLKLGKGLSFASAYNMNQGDKIFVSGFPNYNVGDSGIIDEGKIIGFRPIQGIRRLLINAAIVAGNSGGPVFNEYMQVIGIAATGAETYLDAKKTEFHSVIPIDVLFGLYMLS